MGDGSWRIELFMDIGVWWSELFTGNGSWRIEFFMAIEFLRSELFMGNEF